MSKSTFSTETDNMEETVVEESAKNRGTATLEYILETLGSLNSQDDYIEAKIDNLRVDVERELKRIWKQIEELDRDVRHVDIEMRENQESPVCKCSGKCSGKRSDKCSDDDSSFEDFVKKNMGWRMFDEDAPSPPEFDFHKG